MNKCENCKHWEANNRTAFLPEFGKCHGIGMNYNHTEWIDNKQSVQLKENSKHIMAFVEDGSDYYAALICTKDFGCLMHQEGVYDVRGQE